MSLTPSPVRYISDKSYGRLLARLNPAQHRLLKRHVDRATEVLQEADRLLKGLVTDELANAMGSVRQVLERIDYEEARMVSFELEDLPVSLVPYLDNPFAQSLTFNRFCMGKDLSHTRGQKEWAGGSAAVAARNLPFLPPVYADLWDEGLLDKTRLVAIANRNLTDEAYQDVAELVRTRHKEDVDERLLKMPPSALKVGRRGPEQAMEAAKRHGWLAAFQSVEIAEDLVDEANLEAHDEPGEEEDSPAAHALRDLRAAMGGAHVAEEVQENLKLSPNPNALVEKFLVAHRKAGDPDPEEITKTLFYAHAGPMQKIVADDKLLLRHFRPVKTQKRGQLFYRLLEVIEEALLEKQHLVDLDARGITEQEATVAIRAILDDLNKDPNRYLVIPDEWLGEVTRRHMYFGSRTRKEGAAYKWFRKIGARYYLGGHKTVEEVVEKEKRKSEKSEKSEA